MAAEDAAGQAAASPIAAERVGPGGAGWPFRVLAILLALAVAGLLAFQASQVDSPRPLAGAEAAAMEGDGAWARWARASGAETVRHMSALSSAAGVAALAFAGRRLLHSEAAGLLAGLLLALDPAFLLWGHSALPHAALLGLLLGALAFFLVPASAARWAGAALLSAAALVEPWTLLWSLPLALLVLLRGHIYATGAHLGLSLAQAALLPALAAGAGLLLGGPEASCLRGSWAEEMFLVRTLAVTPGHAALHNPALHFAGMAAALALAAAAVIRVALRFRLARLPGRLQIRLPEPLPALEARTLWVLVLALLAPHPALLWPLLALALAAGVADLGEDAPGFGLALAAGSLVFGAVFLAQVWPDVLGAGGEPKAFLRMVPWGAIEGC